MSQCQCTLCQRVRDAGAAPQATVASAGNGRVYVEGLGVMALADAQNLTARLLMVTGPLFAATRARGSA